MKKTLTITCLIVLAAGTAFAQADPDPDIFGVYFDMDATQYYTMPGYMGYYEAYVMLTNPTAAAGVSGIEFRLEISNDGGELETAALTFSAEGLSPLTAPDFAWGFGTPLPSAPIVHIATHEGATFGNQIEYYVSPIQSAPPSIADSIVYVDAADAGHKIIMLPSSGDFSRTLAVFNYSGGLPTEEETWGGIKAMFR